MAADRQRHRYQPKSRPWYRSPWASVIVVVGFVLGLAVVAAIPVWATDTPAYCASCKATKPAGESWERSIHAKVSCVECHVPPGTLSAIKWRSQEWLNIWADYLNVPDVASRGSRPGNENCLRCHSLNDIPPESATIRMPHEVHVELRDLTCADCHDQVAHPDEGSSGREISMSVCSMCHNADGASDDCEFCHLTPPPEDSHPEDYIETHGTQALADPESCLRCHHSEASFCDPCHANPTPDHFSGTWRYTHGASVEDDPLSCTGCHSEDAFCEQCHRVEHPDDWLQVHGGVAAKGAEPCLVCHPQSMCDRCHEQEGVKAGQ